MSFWRELFDVAARSDQDDDTVPSTPEGKVRVYVFAGHFPDEEALLSYCFDQPAEGLPVPFNRDLTGAYVDTTYVVTGFGAGVKETLDEFFVGDVAAEILLRIGDGNSVVVVSEYAFGDFPFSLNDTPRLSYLGNWLVSRD